MKKSTQKLSKKQAEKTIKDFFENIESKKPKAEEALAKLKIARDETKANSQKVLDDLAAVKALIGTP